MDSFIWVVFLAFAVWVCWRWFLRGWVGNLGAAKSMKAQFAARQIPDEAYFEMAGEELASGTIRKGLWVKAMSEAMGDERKAGAIYIRLRVQAMRQEAAAAIRQASDRGFGAEPFSTVPEAVIEQKIIVSCPKCSGRLRVAAGKHLDVTCAHCQAVECHPELTP